MSLGDLLKDLAPVLIGSALGPGIGSAVAGQGFSPFVSRLATGAITSKLMGGKNKDAVRNALLAGIGGMAFDNFSGQEQVAQEGRALKPGEFTKQEIERNQLVPTDSGAGGTKPPIEQTKDAVQGIKNRTFSGELLKSAGIGDDNLYPTNSAGAANDNAVDLGDASVKWRVVYAGTGSINTSDENEKQQITSLTSAEMTAATAISKLFKNYKWNDAVASKGDDARTHTGVIAQQVQTAMSDAGLDASKYAFWCSNTWWEKEVEVAAVEANEEKLIKAQDAYTRIDTYSSEEEAPEGAVKKTRMGIRYAELLSFIGAATEQRLTSIEARLTALEG